jgi:hypothetical protein
MTTRIKFETREFERAMAEISSESDRTDHEIITMNGQTYLRAVVYNTPRDTGAGRAGFWQAWEALGMAATPGTRRGKTPFKKTKKARRTYVPDGGVVDNRSGKHGEKSFEFINRTHILNERGQKVFYLYILNARNNFWGRATDEAEFKFGRGYERLLKKHSKI